MTDSKRLDYLDWLMTRKEFQNSRRPEEPVSSDMHFANHLCAVYARTLTGMIAGSGSGKNVREAIDKCMATLPPNDALTGVEGVRVEGTVMQQTEY
jgi:hypothetical protein